MKTKILLLTAIAALIVYSCSSDRDEEVQNPASKLELKTVKTNKQQTETSRTGDSITVQTQQAIPPTGFEPEDPNDTELIPPGDIKPPKGGK